MIWFLPFIVTSNIKLYRFCWQSVKPMHIDRAWWLCMEIMGNLVISFPGNFAFGGKYLQFWGEIYHLDIDILVFFFQNCLKICKIFKFLTQFVTIFQGNVAFFQPWWWHIFWKAYVSWVINMQHIIPPWTCNIFLASCQQTRLVKTSIFLLTDEFLI